MHRLQNPCSQAELLQQQIDDATVSADQRLQIKQQKHLQLEQHQHLRSQQEGEEKKFRSSHSADPGAANTCNFQLPGYQLRALSENIAALESNPWIQAPTLPNDINVSSLSNELVYETLNYFVNCGKRLSQMTKTYDDNDAYLLLLQEKEVDLELAARIGQDLLHQNKQLKDSIRNLEDELAKRSDCVAQLKHELASKTSLLDTFIEEEENQTSLAHSEDELNLRLGENISNKSRTPAQSLLPRTITLPTPTPSIDDSPSGFLSLNYQNPRSHPEPFSSLPYHLNATPYDDSRQVSNVDASINSTHIEHVGANANSNTQAGDQQRLVQSVTLQLVESNRKLCELQDMLLIKGEQNLNEQEKVNQLREQLRESERRIGDIALENEALQRSMIESTQIQKDLSDELKACKQNFSELLNVFLELQKETRILRSRTMQPISNMNMLHEFDPVTDLNNISFDSYSETTPYGLHSNQPNVSNHEAFGEQISAPRAFTRNNIPISSSLLEELQESIQTDDGEESSDCHSTDGADSGVHTANNISVTRSASDKPQVTSETASGELSPDEAESENNSTNPGRKWLGFSSYMITSLFLLCMSITLTSSANLNLAQRLQIKLDR